MVTLFLDSYAHTTKKPNDKPLHVLFGIGRDYCFVDTYKAKRPDVQVSLYGISDLMCSIKYSSELVDEKC